MKDHLIAIGETVSDEDLVSVALNGLPVSWETFIAGVSARENQPFFDRLWTDCVQEEGRIMNKGGPQSEENQALVVHAKKGKGRRFPYKKDKGRRNAPNHDRKPRDISQVRCFNCQKLSLYDDKCPDKKRKGKQHASVLDVDDQPQKKSKESNLDEMVEGIRKEYYFISSLSGSITNSGELCLVDSGASRHMTG